MRNRFGTVVVVGALFLMSCGDGSDSSSESKKDSGADTSTDNGKPNLPECPVNADEGKEVTLKVWHSFQRANDDGIKELVNRFKAENPTINVELTQFASYDDLTAKFRAGLEGNGDLPDVVHLEDKIVQLAADYDAVLPMQSCVEADDFDLSTLNARSVDFLTIQDVMYGMPINLSNPVLFFDKSDFIKAGLDPEQPPTTLEEMLNAAKALKEAGIAQPIAFEADSWYFEQWRALADKLFVDKDNGRSGRAQKVAFDDAEAKKVFNWLADLHDAGVSQGYPVDGIDHLLALGNGEASMSIDSSTILGTALQLLNGESLSDKSFELGVGELPSVGERTGGVTVGGGNMFILKNAGKEQQAAAYRMLKFFVGADIQAYWSVQTGYIPANNASEENADLKAAWDSTPVYKVAPKQLKDSPATPATAGVALGAYPEVRDAITNGMLKVLNEGADPEATLEEVVSTSNAAIADYNERLGE